MRWGEHIKKSLLICTTFMGMIISVLVMVNLSEKKQDPRETLIIAMPDSSFIRNIDTNYYKMWLEEKTGLNLQINFIPETYSAEYLEKIIASENVRTDIFLSFNQNSDFLANHTLMQEYGEKGYIIPLNSFASEDTNFGQIIKSFEPYDLKTAISSKDGILYYVPALDISDTSQTAQVYWININWLKKLKLTIPQSTQELYDVLLAFKNNDPNKNGLKDEIPLAGSTDNPGFESYNFIINSFIYNDPDNSRTFVENGKVRFAPLTPQWREAMQYLNKLYEERLLHPLQFKLDKKQLSELANNPANLLGGFTSNSITDILLQSSPEIMSNFIHLPPLSGPDGIRRSTIKTPLPKIGGVITSNCKNPEAAFKLLDLMMSEEAFLISWYGEKGVDWDDAAATDIDAYGKPAIIKVKNLLNDKMQNKHLCKAGPFYTYPKYINSVTWSGSDADHAYVNARAYRIYEMYRPDRHMIFIMFSGDEAVEKQALRNEIDAYTNGRLIDFITGKTDPFDDRIWNYYLEGYESIGLDKFINDVQEVYDTLENSD